MIGIAGIILITIVGFWRPQRVIPSTYGHLQTLVDLIDEWPTSESQILYWGHKRYRNVRQENGEVMRIGHAGTSGNPDDVLPLDLDCPYGGFIQCCAKDKQG